MAEVAVVVVAAGKGTRVGGDLPKQFRRVGDEIMLRRTLVTLVEAPKVGLVQPVIRPEDRGLFDEAAEQLDLLPPAFGGATRQISVRAGLEALAQHKPDIVLVHDAARPFASQALIARAIAAAEKSGAAVPGLAGDRHGQDGRRARLRAADARTRHVAHHPDAARFCLRAAHRSASARGRAWARRFHRRCRARRMGRHESRRVRGRSGQYQDHQCGGLRARGGGAIRGAWRRAHRQRHRRARLCARRSCHARRRAHCAHAQADRPFRRRCGLARADRRHPGRTRRRRYRLAFSAQRSAMEGRGLRSLLHSSRSSA